MDQLTSATSRRGNALAKYVLCVRTSEGKVLGTGFYLAPGRVLTCAHVVEDHPTVRLVPATDLDAEGFVGTVLRKITVIDGRYLPPDLAVLQIDRDDHPVPPLSVDEPEAGEECLTFGFAQHATEVPVGSPASFRFEGSDADGERLQLQLGEANVGLSGAPLVARSHRAIVGIMTDTRGEDSLRGGWATSMFALDKYGTALDTATVLKDNVAFAVGSRDVWSAVDPPKANEDKGIERIWGDFSHNDNSSPSDLLRADFGVVPYLFRDDELSRLQEWCNGPAHMLVKNVPARGGAGKTRFAIELCKRMSERGWTTGFWQEANPDVKAGPNFRIAGVRAPRLIVVDYADNPSANIVGELINELEKTATEMTPARLLLLTRKRGGTVTGTLETLRREHATARARHVIDTADDDEQPVAALTLEQRQTLYVEAVRRFTAEWPDARDPGGALPDLSGSVYDTPLDVLFEAFAQCLDTGAEHRADGQTPVVFVLTHEHRFWRRTKPAEVENLTIDAIARAVALTTLATAADEAEAAILMELAIPDTAGGARGRHTIAEWLHEVYRGDHYLNALRPDRLGEALVAQVLSDRVIRGADLLVALLETASATQVAHVMEVLKRLSVSGEAIQSVVAEALRRSFRVLFWRAREQLEGTATRGPTTIALSAAKLVSGPIHVRLRSDATTPDELIFVGDFYQQLGELTQGAGYSVDAEPLYRIAYDIRTELVERSDDPQNKAELATSIECVADRARDTGDHKGAEGLLNQALGIRRALLKLEPLNPVYLGALARTFERRGDVAYDASLADDAEANYTRGLTLRLRALKVGGDRAEYRRDLSSSYFKLAGLDNDRGKTASADELHRQALTLREELYREDPTRAAYRRDLSHSFSRLGDIARAAGRSADAKRLHTEACTLRLALVDDHPNADHKRILSVSHTKLGDLARSAGDTGEALRQHRAALQLRTELHENDEADLGHLDDLAISYANLGEILRSTGQAVEARRMHRRAHQIRTYLASEAPDHSSYLRHLSVSCDRLGDLAKSRGEPRRAEEFYRESLDIREELCKRNVETMAFSRHLSVSYDRLGDVEFLRGRTAAALRLFERALAIRAELADKNPKNVEFKHNLSVSYERLGDCAAAAGNLSEAQREYRRAMRIRRDLVESDPDNTAYRRHLAVVLDRLGDCLAIRGKVSNANKFFTRAHELRKDLLALDGSNVDYQRHLTISLERLGDVAVRQNRIREARALHMKALRMRRKLCRFDDRNLTYKHELSVSLERVADLARLTGRSTDAQRYEKEYVPLRRECARIQGGNAVGRRGFAISLDRLGDQALSRGDVDGARKCYLRARAIRKQLTAKDPTSCLYRRDVCVSEERLAEAFTHLGDHAKAESSIGEALENRRQLWEQHADQVEIVTEYAATLYMAAVIGAHAADAAKATVSSVLAGAASRSDVDKRVIALLDWARA